MSLKLILMRHAKSGWDDPVEDHDRPLNSRGRISAEVMGKWLQAKGHLPQEALVSTARRTTETFRGLGIAPQKVKFLSSLYHPSAQVYLLRSDRRRSKPCLWCLITPASRNLRNYWQNSPQHTKDFMIFQLVPHGFAGLMSVVGKIYK